MRFGKLVGATVLCLGLGRAAQAQTSYSGTVGTLPVELVLKDVEHPAPARPAEVAGIYAYKKFNTPIVLKGKLLQGRLTLQERGAAGQASATLTIPVFAATSQTLTGTWQNLATGQQLPLRLTRRFVVPVGDAAVGTGYELLEAATLKSLYFKTILSKQPGAYYPTIVGVKLFEKKTGRLVQQLAVKDCQLLGFAHNVAVADYNFDGLLDFSLFEQSYAGPNTSSLYFLYNPATRRYEDSGFEGISLEFDAKAKRIYERNSCCAGTSVTSVVYKLVHNRMVQLAQHCLRWDDKKQDFVEHPWRDCQ